MHRWRWCCPSDTVEYLAAIIQCPESEGHSHHAQVSLILSLSLCKPSVAMTTRGVLMIVLELLGRGSIQLTWLGITDLSTCLWILVFALSPPAEGNKFLSDGGVDCYRRLEVHSRGTHPHRNSETLQHFVGKWADTVQTDYAFLWQLQDQLQTCFHLVFWSIEGIQHAWKARVFCFDGILSERLYCLFFSQANRANCRVRKHYGRYSVVHDPCVWFTTKQPVCKPPPCRDRHRRQLISSGGDIANREDTCVSGSNEMRAKCAEMDPV